MLVKGFLLERKILFFSHSPARASSAVLAFASLFPGKKEEEGKRKKSLLCLVLQRALLLALFADKREAKQKSSPLSPSSSRSLVSC